MEVVTSQAEDPHVPAGEQVGGLPGIQVGSPSREPEDLSQGSVLTLRAHRGSRINVEGQLPHSVPRVSFILGNSL